MTLKGPRIRPCPGCGRPLTWTTETVDFWHTLRIWDCWKCDRTFEYYDPQPLMVEGGVSGEALKKHGPHPLAESKGDTDSAQGLAGSGPPAPQEPG